MKHSNNVKSLNYDYYILIKRFSEKYNISFEDALLIVVKNGMKLEEIMKEKPDTWEEWIKTYIKYQKIKQKKIALQKELEYFKMAVPKLQKSINRAQDERAIITQVFSLLSEKIDENSD